MTGPGRYRGGSTQPRIKSLVVPVSEDEHARIRWLASRLRTDMAPLARRLLLEAHERAVAEIEAQAERIG